ncbi:MAG TPA: nitroreductase family protein [Pseudomonadales bacterium]|nr:nitroreductase family protein [Pseudomonadales bacterium]
MDLYDVMHTTFAARAFTDEPVDDATLRRLLDHARFAPSGGNRQGWRVIAVRDDAIRDELFPLIAPTFQRYMAQARAGEAPWNTIDASAVSDADVAAVEVTPEQLRWLTHPPALLFVFVDLACVASFDAELDQVGVISGCSIYPFVWNLLLAARNEGLGGVPTTFIGARQAELRTLLHVPERFAFAAMIPIGRPVKQLTKLRRRPVDDFASLDHFDGPPLAGA